jgi:hypothetical protein
MSTEQLPSKPSNESDQRLMEAKRLGVGDDEAAIFAGLDPDELQQFIANDKDLQKQVALARVEGFIGRLKKIEESSTATAHKYVIEKLFSDLLPVVEVKKLSRGKYMSKLTLEEVMGKMTPEQMARAIELMEMGRIKDNEQHATQATEPACQTAPPTTPLQHSSSITTACAEASSSATSAPSSASPGK